MTVLPSPYFPPIPQNPRANKEWKLRKAVFLRAFGVILGRDREWQLGKFAVPGDRGSWPCADLPCQLAHPENPKLLHRGPAKQETTPWRRSEMLRNIPYFRWLDSAEPSASFNRGGESAGSEAVTVTGSVYSPPTSWRRLPAVMLVLM